MFRRLSSVFTNDKLKKVLLGLVIAASIIYPTAVGMTMIEDSPTPVLIFVQNDHCVTIFEGHTENQTFDIENSLSLKDGFIFNNEGNVSQSIIRFEIKKLNELGDVGNIFIEETTDLDIKNLTK